MESGVEAGDLRYRRRDGSDGADGGDVMRLVQRRQRHQLLKTGYYALIDDDRLGIGRSAMHDTVADAGKSGLAAHMVLKPVLNGRDGGAVVVAGYGLIRHAAALGIRNLQPGRCPDTLDLTVHAGLKRPVGSRFKHRELDAGRSGVDDEDRLAHRFRAFSDHVEPAAFTSPRRGEVGMCALLARTFRVRGLRSPIVRPFPLTRIAQ